MLFSSEYYAVMASAPKGLTLLLLLVLFTAATAITAFVTYKLKMNGRNSSSDDRSDSEKK